MKFLFKTIFFITIFAIALNESIPISLVKVVDQEDIKAVSLDASVNGLVITTEAENNFFTVFGDKDKDKKAYTIYYLYIIGCKFKPHQNELKINLLGDGHEHPLTFTLTETDQNKLAGFVKLAEDSCNKYATDVRAKLKELSELAIKTWKTGPKYKEEYLKDLKGDLNSNLEELGKHKAAIENKITQTNAKTELEDKNETLRVKGEVEKLITRMNKIYQDVRQKKDETKSINNKLNDIEHVIGEKLNIYLKALRERLAQNKEDQIVKNLIADLKKIKQTRHYKRIELSKVIRNFFEEKQKYIQMLNDYPAKEKLFQDEINTNKQFALTSVKRLLAFEILSTYLPYVEKYINNNDWDEVLNYLYAISPSNNGLFSNIYSNGINIRSSDNKTLSEDVIEFYSQLNSMKQLAQMDIANSSLSPVANINPQVSGNPAMTQNNQTPVNNANIPQASANPAMTQNNQIPFSNANIPQTPANNANALQSNTTSLPQNYVTNPSLLTNPVQNSQVPKSSQPGPVDPKLLQAATQQGVMLNNQIPQNLQTVAANIRTTTQVPTAATLNNPNKPI
jgi:uncharacterized protein YoxC